MGDANVTFASSPRAVAPIVIVPRPGGQLKATTVHQVTSGTDYGSAADWVSGIGSLLAVSVALGAMWFDRWSRERSERQARRTALQLATVRLVSVAQNAVVFMRAISTKVYVQPRAGPKLSFIKPFLGRDAIIPEELSANEISVFGELREVPLLLKVRLQLEMRLAVHAVMRDYVSKYDEFMRVADANNTSTMPNGAVTINGTPAFEQLIGALSDLSSQIYGMAAAHVVESVDLVDELQEAARRHFDDDGLRFGTDQIRSAPDFPRRQSSGVETT